MDEKAETLRSQTETVEADVSAAHEQDAVDTAAATAPGALDLNELQEFSEKKLKALARDLDLHLHPARSRHQHILDIVRAAVSSGATVSAEGFVDQVSDSFAMLRWPKLNFLPVPEDVAIPRTLIEQYDLRPGQEVADVHPAIVCHAPPHNPAQCVHDLHITFSHSNQVQPVLHRVGKECYRLTTRSLSNARVRINP